MDNFSRDWRTLPAEILQIILKLVSIQQSKAESCTLALVCRAWLNTAQRTVYSNITIKTISQFKKFYNVINYNSHLGTKIKTLDLLINSYEVSDSERIEAYNILTSLLATSVPNFEALTKKDSHIPFPSLHTFLDTQLKQLRKIEQPNGFRGWNEVEDYVNAALLMKDRIENLYILCNNNNICTQYQRLYDSLYQFDNLVDVNLEIETSNSVLVFEYIVESCRSLKNIDIKLVIQPDNAVSMDEISKYTSNFNIKVLAVTTDGLEDDNNLLSYIMHKFQQLQYLSLDLKEDAPLIDVHLVTQLLEYVSTINKYLVEGLSAIQNDLMETIGKIWIKTSEPGSEKLHIDFSDYYFEDIKTSFRFTNIKELNGKGSWTVLKYPASEDFDWELYMDFIEEYGIFIRTLRFEIALYSNRTDRSELPKSFFPHTLTYCPNIRDLHIYGCVLKHFVYSVEFSQKFSINELRFQHCNFELGMFGQLSVLLHIMNKLILYENRTYLYGNRLDRKYIGNNYFEITTQYSNIGRLVFLADESDDVIYVKIFTMTDEEYYYYQVSIDRNNTWIKTSTEQEFIINPNVQHHIYFSCPVLPELAIRTEEYV